MTITKFLLVVTATLTMTLCGCQGVRTPPPPVTTNLPPPPAQDLTAVNHIIFMMQENRSFDSYFGRINDFRASQGLGRDVDDVEATFSNPADDGTTITTYHLPTVCVFNTTAAWLESHGDMNRFSPSDGNPLLLDGFVHTAGGLATFDGD